jgi:predicted enzyme related to lactoylglutathione lyase
MTAKHEDEATPLSAIAHGQLCYLQIPAVDVWQSAAFYEKIFGGHIERPYPSFEAPGLIGQWVRDRLPVSDSGLLAWINVDRIDVTLELVRANGGGVLERPSPDGPRWLATIRDHGANVLRIVQHGPC